MLVYKFSFDIKNFANLFDTMLHDVPFLLLLELYRRLKAVFSRCNDVAKHRNTRNLLAWTRGNGDPINVSVTRWANVN